MEINKKNRENIETGRKKERMKVISKMKDKPNERNRQRE